MALSFVWSSALQSASVRLAPATFVERPGQELVDRALELRDLPRLRRPAELREELARLAQSLREQLLGDGPAR
jgi:hypothetical protein